MNTSNSIHSMQAMQVDEALAHADEWIKGVTLYEGAQGWRVACATLAAEVRRMRAMRTAQGPVDVTISQPTPLTTPCPFCGDLCLHRVPLE